jgi:hypothetical protein
LAFLVKSGKAMESLSINPIHWLVNSLTPYVGHFRTRGFLKQRRLAVG